MEITKEQIEILKLGIALVTAVGGGFGGLLMFFLKNINQQLKSIKDELKLTREQQIEHRAEIANIRSVLQHLPCRYAPPQTYFRREKSNDVCQQDQRKPN